MTTADDDAVLRRIDALERAIEKRFDDAVDIHRREHESSETAHAALHHAADLAAERAREQQSVSGQQFLRMYEERWASEKDARSLAATAVDKRLEQMNEFRSQLQSQAATFVTNAAHSAAIEGIQKRLEEIQATIVQRFTDTAKHTDDRYEDNRKRIENLEKGDVKQEGKGLGQGTVIAAVVTAITVVGGLLGIVIILANIATGTP